MNPEEDKIFGNKIYDLAENNSDMDRNSSAI